MTESLDARAIRRQARIHGHDWRRSYYGPPGQRGGTNPDGPEPAPKHTPEATGEQESTPQ